MRHLLVVHTAGDPRAWAARLRAGGFRCSLLKKRPTPADEAACERVIDWDYQDDVTGTLALAARLHAEDPFHGVISFSESGVIAASLVAAHLGLPGNPPGAVLRARNKFLMRRALQAHGLAGPPFRLVRDAAQVCAALRAARLPMVLKPISGSSSYGVVRLTPDDTEAEVQRHLQQVTAYIGAYRQNNPQYPFEFWLPPAGHGIAPEDVFDPAEVLLLEGFLEGQQVSVDGTVADDRVNCYGVIEIERIRDADYFLEFEEWLPTRLGLQREQEICAVVRQAVAALGLRRGCFHCELKVTPTAIAVIEIAARRGADNIADFLDRAMGVDIYLEGARLAVGDLATPGDPRPRAAMKMRYFLPPQSGILRAVTGAERVRADARVGELVLDVAPGDLVLTPPEGFEFLGYVSVHGPTPQDADRALEEVYAQIRFHIDAAPGSASVS
jgi:biotin carboxylase